MPLYVTLLEGPSPAEARALLASDDQHVVDAVIRALRSRFPATSTDDTLKVVSHPNQPRLERIDQDD